MMKLPTIDINDLQNNENQVLFDTLNKNRKCLRKTSILFVLIQKMTI